MAKTLRPTAQAFRELGWLPASDGVYNKFMKDLTNRASNENHLCHVALLQPIQDFKTFIENDPVVYQEFVCMFEGIEESPRNYHELCNMFNEIFRRAPYYGDLGPPVYMAMAKIMNTRAGFSAFTRESLNFHFKRLFDTWGLFLSSPASRDVLVADKFDSKHYGWFSEPAKAAMMAQYDGRTFEQVFICDETAPYHGFKSYDDFFNRKFRAMDIDRPVVGGIANTTLIGSPCEALSYNISDDVHSLETLYFKGEGYSLRHLLHDDPSTEQFEHGSIIQGFLNITGYHRWHAPVSGTIMKIVDVPGTYFAQAPSTIGDPFPVNDYDPQAPYLRSLAYFSNIAARQIIFIQADNEDIGLIYLILIGMTEVSTCEALVCPGQHVERGDDLGMFHFGGSSFALGLRKNSKAAILEELKTQGTVIKVNDVIAAVQA